MRLHFLAPTARIAAAAAPDGNRVRAGLALPFGQVGRTSAGQLRVGPGAIRIPEDLRRVKLFTEHGRHTPVGYAIECTETDAGLHMAFHLAGTPAGNSALLEADEGVRDALSVELDDVTVEDGEIIEARLVAVALTSVPAYDAARIAASDTDTDDQDDDDQDDEQDDDDDDTEVVDPPAAPTPTQANAARVPARVTAARRVATVTPRRAQLTAAGTPMPRSIGDAAQRLALSAQSRGIVRGMSDAAEITAALADVTPNPAANGLAGAFLRPQWLGELWTPEYAQRDFVDAVGSSPLTSMKWQGFKWETRPEVDKYAGDKTEIPTNEVKIVPAEGEGYRVAGGWDVDRIFIDLASPGFIEAMFRAATADYRMKSEDWLASDLQDGASVAGPATDLVEALDLLVRTLTSAGARLSWVAMATDVWSTFLGLDSDSVPWWLKNQASVNIGDTSTTVAGIRIFCNHALDPGVVMGGDRNAVDFREAGPLRVQAVNIPNGGIDIALFGYQGTLIQDARGLVKVTITAAAEGLTAGNGNGTAKKAAATAR